MDESISLELPKRSEHLVWTGTILLSVINVVAFSGNISVCYAVYRKQRLRFLPNMFVVALVVSDISISICCMPFSVSTLYHGRWIFGTKICRVQGFTYFTFGMAFFNPDISALQNKKSTSCYSANEGFLCSLLVCVEWPLLDLCLHFFFARGGYGLTPGHAACMYTFETNIAYTIFVKCVYIATSFSLITFCYIKVFCTVSRTNQLLSQENSPQKQTCKK